MLDVIPVIERDQSLTYYYATLDQNELFARSYAIDAIVSMILAHHARYVSANHFVQSCSITLIVLIILRQILPIRVRHAFAIAGGMDINVIHTPLPRIPFTPVTIASPITPLTRDIYIIIIIIISLIIMSL
jgi:hypothetical protein